MPSHSHAGKLRGGANGDGGNASFATNHVLGYSSDYNIYWSVQPQGGGQAHDHDAGMPANIAIYAWKRTA